MIEWYLFHRLAPTGEPRSSFLLQEALQAVSSSTHFLRPPLFHWPTARTTMGLPFQRAVLTDAGAAHFNGVHSTEVLTMGLHVGSVRSTEGEVEVYALSGAYMGRAPNRQAAAEELVRLYVRQHSG